MVADWVGIYVRTVNRKTNKFFLQKPHNQIGSKFFRLIMANIHQQNAVIGVEEAVVC
jgi:hypothetical protein